MPTIDLNKHEQFAQLVAKGINPVRAYVSVGYSDKGAAQGAARLLKKVPVCGRIKELQETLSAGVIALEIRSRNARLTALQKRWDRLRSALDLLLDQRGADMADIPGGASGILYRDYKGTTGQMVTRIDPGVVSLVGTLLAHERQAAEELAQWKARVSPASVRQTLLFSTKR